MQFDTNHALGIYVSIPFCRSKCTYCNFASGVYPASEHERYVSRLIDDLRAAGAWTERMGAALPRSVDTIYLGGGTPSLLAPELLRHLFEVIRAEFDVDPNAEITVEGAPGQIADEFAAAMAAVGVNRVSLGVQSFVDREAAVSGRLHTRVTVESDIRRLREAGIGNINVDLIAGLAGQTPASWEESLAALIDSGVPHASVYMLEVDEDSRLGREVLARGSRYYAGLVPSDDAIAGMYRTAIEQLSTAGLMQYEISNFAQPGLESRHNLRYWQRRPYLGVGLDASSALFAAQTSAASSGTRAMLRSTATSELKAYLENGCEAESEWLTPAQQHEEAWFLGLRLNAGVDLAQIKHEFGAETAAALRVATALAGDGLLTIDNDTVKLTAQGQLLSNEVFEQFIDLEPELALAPV